MAKTFNSIATDNSFDELGTWMIGLAKRDFSNEVIRSHALIEKTFFGLTFLNCDFINVEFHRNEFVSCNFTNCTFSDILLWKCQFGDCTFKNSKIVNSDFSRTEFGYSHFIECEFNEVIMAGTTFDDCEFIKPKFNKIVHLDNFTLSNSRIWNSGKCIEVNDFDDLEKIFNELKD